MSYAYKGFGIEAHPSRTVVVRWGVIHEEFKTEPEARAFVDGRTS